MVKTIPKDLKYFHVKDRDLETFLQGEIKSRLRSKNLFECEEDLKSSDTGVLVAMGESRSDPPKPIALIAHEKDVRRLCGRFAHVRPDFAPLTTWCHLLKPEFSKNIDGIVHKPKFDSTLAAWCGVVAAETVLLNGRGIAEIDISTCFASSTYAIARSKALWPRLSIEDILNQVALSSETCGTLNIPKFEREYAQRVRSAFDPLWNTLTSMMHNSNTYQEGKLAHNVEALQILESERKSGNSDEASKFVVPLSKFAPEVGVFDKFSELVPEKRLELFDDLVDKFKKTDSKDSRRRDALAMLCGYLSTKAAGGAPSISLVNKLGYEAPELIGWTFLIGGIGEPITWSSGFDGLGRLIARELNRPFRLDEPPTCDFALDEAVVLLDRELKDPLVHLKIKRSKDLSVALFPGVNIGVPTVEARRKAIDAKYHNKREVSESSAVGTKGDLASVLSDFLWPKLRERVVKEISFQAKRKTQRAARYTKARTQVSGSEHDELPLHDKKE